MAPVDEAAMALALAELALQDEPNINGTANKHGLSRTTLRARFYSIHRSRAEAASLYSRNLTDAQEEVLIGHINRLTNRGIPPTTQMVRNFAEEIIQEEVGHCWTSNFVNRHKDRLHSKYLRTIDRKRFTAESTALFQEFYAKVCGHH